ncbi:MAG: hypothetical protein KDD51_13080, partial [Bdellovibrionales bacterium]|nr:hypothetical protein [Bdellovibrionales bacterium]
RGDANILPARLSITRAAGGAASLTAGDCVPLSLNLSNTSGDPASPKSAMDVLLVVVQGTQETGDSFYTHEGCSALNRAPRVAGRSLVVFGSGVSQLTVYLRHTQSGNIKIRSYVPSVQSGDYLVAVSPTSATAFTFTGPAFLPTGSCGQYLVSRTDRYLNTVPGSQSIPLSSNSGGFFSNSNCSVSTSSVLLNSSGTGTTYFLNDAAAENDLTASASSVFVVTTQAGLPSRLAIEGATQLGRDLCGRYEIGLQEGPNPTVSSENTLVTPSGGSFYSNPSCTVPISSALLQAQTEKVPVFYKAAGTTATLGASASGLAGDTENVAITSAGALDLAFNSTGRILANGTSAVAAGVAASGNSYFVAGTSQSTTDSDFVVAKFIFNDSGASYSLAWLQTIDVGSTRDVAHGVAVDSSGNVVVVGTTVESGRDHVAVVRLLGGNGALDDDFAGGIVKTSVGAVGDAAHAVAIQPNGQILVVGASRRVSGDGEVSDMLAVRYSAVGALLGDSVFDFNGARGSAEGDDAAYAVQAVSNSLAYVSGYGRAGRYLNMAYASLDANLSPGAKTLVDFGENHHDVANSILVSGSDVYLGGYTRQGNQNLFALARLATSGAVQNQRTLAFEGENNGVVRALARQDDGKIIAIGYAGELGFGNAFAVARFSSTLAPDLAFGTNGRLKLHLGDGADEAVGGVLVGSASNRRLIVAGSSALPASGNPKALAATRFNVAD